MTSCWLCDGSGRWDCHASQQTLICPVCRPQEAEHQALAQQDLPTWHPSLWTQLEARHYGPRFQVEPWLLVIHSGAIGDGVAEYLANPGDGRKVSAHISWSRQYRGFVQQVPLSHVAWHCGGSRYNGQGRLNQQSIGIELPGPWDKERGDDELGLLRETVIGLLGILPLTTVVRHSDIDNRKKDPGPGFRWDCLAGLGLEIG